MITLSLLPQYFDLIASGKKTVEGRINTEKFAALKIGDGIAFTRGHTEKRLVCAVKSIHRYKDFRSMLIGENIEHMLPGIVDLDQAVALYESLPGYKEKVQMYGAIAMGISLEKAE